MPWALPDHVAAPANRPHIGAKRGLMPRFFSRNRSGWMRDPYEVLGVQKSASPEDIKRAFRRLAKKLHPDANKKDATAAKFAELNSAYELLGDEKKRKAFDRGEIDAEGKPRFHGFQTAGAGRGPGGFGREGHFETFTWGPEGFRRSTGRGGGFGRFEDILGDMFGATAAGTGRRRSAEAEDFDAIHRGQDIAAALTITLEEAAKGAMKRMRLPTGKDVDVKIPPGLTDGQQIRLKGQGLPGHGGPAGDALISVAIARTRCSRPRAPICASSCRLRFTRPSWERRFAFRPSKARWSWPFRPAPMPAARSGSRAKACRSAAAAAISSSPRASCSPTAPTPSSRR